jgi:hypothetical protein
LAAFSFVRNGPQVQRSSALDAAQWLATLIEQKQRGEVERNACSAIPATACG